MSPGTIWASVVMPGSHDMLRLHVCIDMMILPFVSMILTGYTASRMFTAVDPSTRKCPVVSESEKAHSITFFDLIVLKMVFATGDVYRLLA